MSTTPQRKRVKKGDEVTTDGAATATATATTTDKPKLQRQFSKWDLEEKDSEMDDESLASDDDDSLDSESSSAVELIDEIIALLHELRERL